MTSLIRSEVAQSPENVLEKVYKAIQGSIEDGRCTNNAERNQDRKPSFMNCRRCRITSGSRTENPNYLGAAIDEQIQMCSGFQLRQLWTTLRECLQSCCVHESNKSQLFSWYIRIDFNGI